MEGTVTGGRGALQCEVREWTGGRFCEGHTSDLALPSQVWPTQEDEQRPKGPTHVLTGSSCSGWARHQRGRAAARGPLTRLPQ